MLFLTLRGATYSKCFHNEWFQNCLQCCRYVHVLSNPCLWVSICYTSFLLYFPEKSKLKIHLCCIRFKILCICIFCLWIVLYSQSFKSLYTPRYSVLFQGKEWKLLYDSQEHGQSLNRCSFVICTFLKQQWGNLIDSTVKSR